MVKKLRIYQISLIAVSMLCIGLLAFMGITAIQKSMTLKMQFEVSPAVAVKLEIYNTDASKWDLIFQNSGQGTIKDGITLNGNTLGFRSEYANGLGNEFTLKLTSLSSSEILAEFGGASFSQSKLLFTDSAAQTVEVYAVDNLTIDFSKVVQVSIQDSSNGGLTLASENLVEFTQDQQTTYYAKTHQALVLVYDMNSSHKNHSIEATISDKTVGEITTENNQMTLSIPATALTGSVSVTLSAEMNQLTVNYNGLTNINSTNTTTIMEPNTPYTTILTVNEGAVNIDDYSLPEVLNVTIGSENYTLSKYDKYKEGEVSYTEKYNKSTGKLEATLTIPAEKNIGDISITGAVEIAYWDGVYPRLLKTAGGTGSESAPYLIATAKELASLSYMVNYEGEGYDNKHFKLLKNIYLNKGTVDEDGGETSYQWEAIGNEESDDYSFYGYFDGNNFTINGMYITSGYGGLFGYGWHVRKVSNVIVDNGYISTGGGGIMDNCYGGGTIKNCVNLGVDIVGGTAGGIIGDSSGTILDCFNFASISGSCAGGIVGYLDGDIVINCFNIGNITSTGEAGGIAGSSLYNSGYFINCYNIGSVKGENVGGIVGATYDPYETTMMNVFNAGNLQGTNYTGCLLGTHEYSDDKPEWSMACWLEGKGASKAIGDHSWSVGTSISTLSAFVTQANTTLNSYASANGYRGWSIANDGTPSFT